MIRSLLRYATVNGYIKQNSLGGINYSDIYNINKAKATSKTVYELGWINHISDLRSLIEFIENMPNETYRNAYKMSFYMKLRLKINKNKKVLFTL